MAMDLYFSSFVGTARLVPSHQGPHFALHAPWEVASTHSLPQILAGRSGGPPSHSLHRLQGCPCLLAKLYLYCPSLTPECHLRRGVCQVLLQPKYLITSRLSLKFTASSRGWPWKETLGPQTLLNIGFTQGSCFSCRYLGPTHRNSSSDVWGRSFNSHYCQAHHPLRDTLRDPLCREPFWLFLIWQWAVAWVEMNIGLFTAFFSINYCVLVQV